VQARLDSLLSATRALLPASDEAGIVTSFQRVTLEFEAFIREGGLASVLRSYLIDWTNGIIPKIEDGKPGEIVFHYDLETYVSMARYAESAKHLHSHPLRGVFKVISGAAFPIRRYALPQSFTADVFDPHLKLSLVREELVKPGDIVPIDGRREVLWFGFVSETTVVKCFALLPVTLNWAFDMDTLMPIDTESTEQSADSLVHCAELAMVTKDRRLVPGLLAASRHRAHFVRWRCIQALWATDPAEAIKRLELAAAEDQHPEVVSSARNALRTIRERENSWH
jgi:hypothetical protein